MTTTLSKTQQELLDAMRGGVVVRFAPYAGRLNPNEYFYRIDNFRRCTAAARALLEKGLVEECNKTWRGSTLRLTATGEQA